VTGQPLPPGGPGQGAAGGAGRLAGAEVRVGRLAGAEVREVRRIGGQLHQLHPLLVHVCLFGAAYRDAALGAARAALAAG
jgi:hypothetical protein